MKTSIDARIAYSEGNYAKAAKLFRSLAEQGNADAQSHFGVMYDLGRGVPQNYKEAVKWYRLAAEQGDTSGQWRLGAMYEVGKGVLQTKLCIGSYVVQYRVCK